MSAVPHTEAPIYVEYAQIGDEYNFNLSNDTAMERRPVARNECWLDLLSVPNVAPAPAPWPGGAVLGLTRGISGVPLGPVPGNAFRFAYRYSTPAPGPPYDHFMNMVPAVYSGGIFRPTLRDAFGRVVPYNPSVWVADGLLQLVEFKYHTPQALGFAPPFTIDYWQYVGPVAGSGTLANDGAGARVYEVGTADPSLLRTIAPDAANLGASVTETASEILIGNTMTGVNLVPAGPDVGQVFQQKDPATGNLDFRAVEPDPSTANLGIAISQTGTAVVVGNTMTGANLEPAGPGVGQVFAQKNSGTGALEFRTIDLDATPANLGLALTQTSTALTVGNTMTGVNLEPADPLTALVFAQKNAATGDLEFRALEAGLNVSLSASATGIMISATPGGGGGITGLTNSGTGADVYATLVATTAVLRRLNATTNGITITQNVPDITFDNTLTGNNVGAGVQLFRNKTTNFLNFRTFIADPSSGVIFTQNADDITVSLDPSAVTSIANEGAGTGQIFDTVMANVANLRTLQIDPTVGNGGIAIATIGLVINIGNTMTGANVGAGTGTVFSAKTAAGILQLNSFAGTANGLTVSAPAANVITIDNTLTGNNLGAGALLFTTKTTNLLNFRSLIAAAGSGLTLTQNTNDVTINAAVGTVVTMSNEGAGTGQIFDGVVANVANLRSLQADPSAGDEGIEILTAGQVITIGNTMTGANIGAGAGTVFSAKTAAAVLQLNSFAGTANGLTVSAPAAGTITIDNTLTGANVGVGTGTVFSAKSGATLQLNSFAGTANGLTVSTPAANVITIDNTLTGNNVGAGAFLFRNKTANFVNMRSLIAAAGSGLTITQNTDDVTISATAGTAITIANEGAGTGSIFDSVVANVANLRTLQIDPTAGNGGIAIVTVGLVVNIGNTMTGSNVGAGTGTVFSAKTAAGLLQLNSFAGTANGLTVSAPVAGTITIDNTLTGANVGAGSGTVFSAKSGATLQLNSFAGTANGLTVSAPVANVITIDNTLTGNNVGAGAGLFRDKTANFVNLRSLIAAAGSGLTIIQNADDVTISATAGTAITIANEGAGTGSIFDAVVANVANLRTLQIDPTAGNGGIAIATVGLVVNIGNTMTGANVGAGTGTVFSAKSGATLQLNTFAGTANGLTVSAPAANVITIDNTLTGANVGAGTGTVFSAKSGATLQLNSFAGTANGLTVSAPAANVITIDNTLTGNNLGAGALLFTTKTTNLLNFRSLIAAASSGLTLTQNANDVTISATAGAVVTALANEGAGTGQIFDAVVANVANLRTLQIDPTVGNGGIAIATVGLVVNIGNTMTGANVGAGTGTVFSAKTAAGLLQLNTFAGTANGLTVSAPAANVITIDNTLTGNNLGTGALLFTTKTTNLLNFRSLIAAAGSGLTLTQNTNDVTFSASAGSVVTIANEGAGTGQIFDAVVANAANLRTLQIDPTAGNEGITIATVGLVVNIGNTMTGANVGAGTGTVFSAKTAAGLLQLNSFAGTANGLTVSAPAANVITIDNTLTGANVGAGTGTVFSAKSGATLQLNSFAGTLNGLTVSAPVANVITIDNTLTGGNVGAGSQLFSGKSGASLNFRSLIATVSSGISLTQNTNDITFSLPNHNTWVARDQKTTGTNGGNFAAATWVPRDLNTLQSFGPSTGNVILGGGNEIDIVNPGTYLIFAVSTSINPIATNRVGFNQLRLQNTSSLTTVAFGTSECLPDVDNSTCHPTVMAEVTTTLASTKFQVQHFKTTAGTTTNGLGLATGIATNNECYTIVLISQIN